VALATIGTSSLLAITGMQPALAATGGGSLPAAVTVPAASPVKFAADGEYAQRFLAQYDKIKDPANGYFSPQGIPYHSVETLLVEAPDYGHETTSRRTPTGSGSRPSTARSPRTGPRSTTRGTRSRST